jgi:acylphosphatase
MAIKRVKLLIKGKVQGVYFREFAKQNANKLGVVGYAKNLKNDLEIVAQGEGRKVDEFVQNCKRGPMFAHVDNVEISDEQVTEDEFECFDIR